MKGYSIFRILLAFTALVITLQSAFAWWNYGWEKRRSFILNNSGFATGTDTVTILITITPADSIYPNTQAAGQDIRFVDADDATMLDHEIELWDTAGTSFVWVQVPDIADSTQRDSIWFYYHNTFCADGQDTAGTWDGGYMAVWHMNEDTAYGLRDRTANAYDEADNFGTVKKRGLIGYAREFDFVSDEAGTYVRMEPFDIVSADSGLTIEAWVYAYSYETVGPHMSQNRIIEKANPGAFLGDDAARYWMVSTNRANDPGIPETYTADNVRSRFRLKTTDDLSATNTLHDNETNPPAANMPESTWYYVVGWYDAGSKTQALYVDGVLVASETDPTWGDIAINDTTPVFIGGGCGYPTVDDVYNPWDGMIDEVRISNMTRSASWIQTQYLLKNNSGYTAGAEEQGPPTIAAAEYHSSGTDGVNGDSLIVQLSFGILDATLPSTPDSMFGIVGLGGIDNATLTTGSVANDNIVVVKFSGTDTILCHNRTQVVLYDSVVTGPGGKPCEAGTVAVTTYNVMIPRTGAVYQTLNQGYAAAVANDSLLVFDAGEYPETLAITQNTDIIGYGIDYPGSDSLPVILDPQGSGGGYRYLIDLVTGNMSCYLYGLKLVSQTDSMRAINVPDYNNQFDHTYRNCVFEGSGAARECFLDDFVRGKITLDSCEFTGFTNLTIYWRHDDWGSNTGKYFTNCYFHDTKGPGIFFQDSRELVVENCIFENVYNSYGIIYIPACNNLTISGNRFDNCTGSGNGVIVFSWNCNNYSVDNNVFNQCTNPAGAITFSRVYNGTVFNNLIYGGARGINISGGANTYRNLIAFNTIVNCTDGGIIYNGNSTAQDTISYNISWRNGPSDLQLSGGTPVADFNFYDPGRNQDWPVGAHTDSGYPAFVDTGADNYRLLPSSPCIDFTDVDPARAAAMGAATDLDGNGRSAPAGTYADAGCYEEQVTGVLRIRNVDYWSCGTSNMADDSMKVLFQHNLDFGTLPTGAGSADAVFGNIGLGSMAGATIDTPSVTDTNYLFIRMAGGDTIFSHLRSGLRIDGGSTIRSDLGFSAQTDTATVNTYNVYNMRTDTGYATIKLAMESSVDADTVKVFDNGYYLDTLSVVDDIIFTNAPPNRPIVRFGGDTTSIVHGAGGANGYLVVDGATWSSESNPEFHGFEFDGRNLPNTDNVPRLVGFTKGKFYGCVFHHADQQLFYAAGGGSIDSMVLDSCEFYGSSNEGIRFSLSQSSRSRIVNCLVHDNAGNGLFPYGGDSTLIRNNWIYNNGGAGLYLRNGDANIIQNNLIYGNTGRGILMYASIAGDLPTFNKLINNTVYGNGGGGMELDSMGRAVNNLCFGNTGWDIRKTASVGVAVLNPDSITFNLADSTGGGMGAAYTAANGNVVSVTDALLSDPAQGDLHLRLHSPAIDRGDSAAAFNDYDGSRCDIGAYGGPYAIDTLYPHRTDTLIVVPDQASGYATDSLYWGNYSLGDFALFAVYRDTFAGFVPSAANCVDSVWNAAATGISVPGNGKDNVYKVSVANDTMYGGGYRTGACAKVYFLKTSNRNLTVPGDTITYTLYYDNDGDEVSAEVFTIIDSLPARAEYLDTAATVLHAGGSVDVDWYNGTAWQESEPAAASVRAVRWEIQPGIGAHDGSGDASGEDQTKTGMDMNGGTDAGRVSFKVIVK